MYSRLPALLPLSLLLLQPTPAPATELGDPAGFQVNVNADGTFGKIWLNSYQLDSAEGTQRQFANGFEFTGDKGGSPGPVTLDTPLQASYTAYIGDSTANTFKIDVVTTLLGPYPGISAANAWFEQLLTFTNVSGTVRELNTVSYVVPGLNGAGQANNTVSGNGNVLVAVDTTTTYLMVMATRPSSQTSSAQVATYGDIPYPTQSSDLDGNLGPVGPGETEMALGVDLLAIPAGGTASVSFRYLFGIDMTQAPEGFPAPAPATFALMALGLAGLSAARRRA